MRVRYAITFIGELPPDTQVGDKLAFDGTFTIHRIAADIVEVSGLIPEDEYLLGEVEVGALCNQVSIRPLGAA